MFEPVAKRYASALFAIARSKDRIEQFDDQSDALEVIFSDKVLQEFFTSPDVPMARKKELLDSQLGSALEPEFLSMLKLLVEKNRMRALTGILRYFDLLTDKHRGVEEVTIVSASTLSEDEKNRIVETAKRFSSYGGLRVMQEVDPEIIGGIIVRLGDFKVLDGSVRSRLDGMRSEVMSGGRE